MKTIKVIRLSDSKKGTFKKNMIYEAVIIGNETLKVKVNNNWKYAKKSNFKILED